MEPLTPEQVLKVACDVIEPIRETARQFGYVVAIHGSLQRDIDLIAIPWDRLASGHTELFAAVVAKIRGLPDWRGWRSRPHRRMARAIEIRGTYIDFSVVLK